jgi:hypothetical protein
VADQEKDNKVKELRQSALLGVTPTTPSKFGEETSCELVGPVSLKKSPMASTASNSREEISHELAVVPVSIKKAPAVSTANREETAAEIAAPVSLGKIRNNDNAGGKAQGKAQAGTGIGFLALALSILSLFVMPILFGAAGIIVGFIARSRGARGLGAWAIGIGVVSIIIGIFITPFF